MIDFSSIKLNEYQTKLTEKVVSKLTDRYQEALYEVLTTVPYIQNLISPDRRYVKDMPKDELGRIIPDYENPHILTNTDFFTESARHFQKHGCYTL